MRRARTAIWSAVTAIGLTGALAVGLSPSARALVLPPTPAAGSGSAPASPTPAAAPVAGADSIGSAPVVARVAAVAAPTADGRTGAASTAGSQAALQQFWTPARLAAATATLPGVTGSGDTKVAAAGAAPRTGTRAMAVRFASATTTTLKQAYFGSSPTIGILVYADKNMKTHFCTASVVQSPTKNLILTAAHCRPGSWVAYIPDYVSGAAVQPYGIWAVKTVYTDSHYAATGSGTDYDYAFAKVAPDSKGRLLQNVTNGNVLTRTPSYNNWAGLTGYPEVASASADKSVTCWNHTSKLPGYAQMQLLCGGFYSGTSGSPWLININSRTHLGQVVGVIGGLNYGGANNWTNNSPMFGNNVFSLYAYAVKH
ncbi:trypsin-like serine peptidase [Streptacidiphilus albus]|uniref:trypsin-like serine peptidase n=1 Tax=Streptacidiphilus albus TaxID=105425 RepID=UPI00068D6E18|nr:trypsin-like serine protease [Streptacidiphilus albus]